jgi:thioredoxin-related protein
MKKTVFIVVLMVFAIHINAQEINWVSFEEAIALQKKKPKKIMMDVYTNWCGPCKMLDKNTFNNKDVVDYVNKNYYAVKFNAEGDESINFNGKTYINPDYNPANANRRNSVHQLARYFSIRSYPTIVFLGEDAEFLTPVIGYKKPQQLELYLKLFNSDDYKNFKSQDDFTEYYDAFVPEFVE